MADIITIAGISQEAKTYQPQLRMLPYAILGPELAKLGIQLMQVAGVDVTTQAQRKGGLLKPYATGTIDYSDDFIKFREAELKTERAYISMKDNVLNYESKKLMNKPLAGDGLNQTKKHPSEELITSQVVITAAEDVLDALFPAERNLAVKNPLGAFDGYDTKINNMISSTEISVANKNVVNTGAIVAPVDNTDTTALNQVVAFIRSAHPMLKKFGILKMTTNVYLYLVDTLENKMSNKTWDIFAVEAYLNQKSGSRVKLIVTDYMGTGDRMILTIPGNFHFGMNTFSDVEFVQVRNVEEDPNIVQFWLQASFGTRIASIHPKEFQINDGTPVANALSGDYQ